MNGSRILGLILIAAGVLALVYHGFSYTRDEHEAKVGPVELSVAHRSSVDIPTWAGAGVIVIGAALLVLGGRKG
jgi:drug/metabolite transporter (DMT)-like permease